jgi:hypothetical protein
VKKLLPSSLLIATGLVAAPLAAESASPEPARAVSAMRDTYHYFRATRDDRSCPYPACGGYFVTPLDAATAPCGATRAASCYVADIDLGSADFERAEAAALLGAVTAASDAFSLVFTGRVVPRAGDESLVLEARELWESSRPVPAGAALHHVTRAATPCAGSQWCAPVDSVALGSWEGLRSGRFQLREINDVRLDLTKFPDCTGNTPSSMSVMDLTLGTFTGILAAGSRTAESFEATSVLLRRMPDADCNHKHGGRPVQCCGATTFCRAYSTIPDFAPVAGGKGPQGQPSIVKCYGDHILGGIEFEYERSNQLGAWLTSTNQPLSPTSHDHPALTP